MARVVFDSKKVIDWPSFHSYSAEVFGFPNFYGKNMDAWIDCMSSIDYDDGLNKFKMAEDELLEIEILETKEFKERLPEIFEAMIECVAFCNWRNQKAGLKRPLSLILT